MNSKLFDIVTGVVGVGAVEGVDSLTTLSLESADRIGTAAQSGEWVGIVGQILIALATFWKLIFGSPEQVAARKEKRKFRKDLRKIK
jgi:hypothetical protein